jgi:multisubunit Na+/H+ antiporter MnhC subunit
MDIGVLADICVPLPFVMVLVAVVVGLGVGVARLGTRLQRTKQRLEHVTGRYEDMPT